MFGRKTREIQVELEKTQLEIEKIKVRMEGLENNMRSTRGLVNRRMRTTLEEEEEQQEEEPIDAATMQRNLLGFK